MSSGSTVSIVVPAYNEQPRLPNTLKALADFARAHPQVTEVLIVDDGSRDETSAIARHCGESIVRLISYGPNAGKGYAVRRGVMEAQGDQILVTDADLSTPLDQMVRLQRELERAEVVIGSRAVDDSQMQVRQAWYRQAMGKTFNRITRALTGLPYKDTQCGFKLLRRDAARTIFAEAVVDRFAFDVEMLLLADQHGYRVVETGVPWFNSPDSRVRIIRDSLRMLVDISRVVRRLGRARPREQADGETLAGRSK